MICIQIGTLFKLAIWDRPEAQSAFSEQLGHDPWGTYPTKD